MKRILLLIAVMLLIPFSITINAQESVSTASLRLDDGEVMFGISGGIKLTESLWGFGSGVFGEEYDTGELQLVRFFVYTDKFNAGILFSPLGVDWVKDKNGNTIANVAGSGGFLLNYWFKEKISAYGAMQYKYDYDTDNSVWNQSGVVWHIGIAFKGLTFGLL